MKNLGAYREYKKNINGHRGSNNFCPGFIFSLKGSADFLFISKI